MSSNRKRKRRQHQAPASPHAVQPAPVIGEIPPTSRWYILMAAMLIIVGGVIVYSNSFSGPFILDDPPSITNNPHIRSLWPIWDAMKAPAEQTTAGRPILSLSLAITYACSGLEVWGYHAFNLAIHILAALTLFGIVRRTLLTDRMRTTFGRHSLPLALICAMFWLVHPLQTQAVTYVIQRAESMMGLFYLLTLYCAIRSFASKRLALWAAASIIACCLAMGTKAVAITAPLVIVIYGLVFTGDSLLGHLKRRWWLYVGLAATWTIQIAIIMSVPRGKSAGFGISGIFTSSTYAQTQCSVIWQYIRLSFWPSPLVLDYHWERAFAFKDYALPGAGVLALLAATLVAFRYRPALGFCGAWFFLILGPTSSFLPLNDPIFEHRMYLPLAAVVAIVVLAGYWLAARKAPRGGLVVGAVVAAAIATSFGFAAHERNNDYSTAESIWRDTATKRPGNPRGHSALAAELLLQERYDEALASANTAIELVPSYKYPYTHRATIYINRPSAKGEAKSADYALALADLDKALELDRQNMLAYELQGKVHERRDQSLDAIRSYSTMVDYGNPAGYFLRAGMYAKLRKYDQAISDYRMAVDPARPDARFVLAFATTLNQRGMDYGKAGKFDLAIIDFTRAIELKPNYFDAYSNRAMANNGRGDYPAAIRDYTKAIELNRNFASAYYHRAGVYDSSNQLKKALADYRIVVRLAPNHPDGHYKLALALANTGQIDQARKHLTRAATLAKAASNAKLHAEIQAAIDRMSEKE